jgi:hypothetical protein
MNAKQILYVPLSVALLSVGCLFATGCRTTAATTNEPMMLDASRFYYDRFVTPERTNGTFAAVNGVQVFDGLPFDVRGRGCLYGEKEFNWNRASSPTNAFEYPDFIGLPVGRTFDELHVLDACRWADVQGQTIAYVRLNYADGTRVELPVKFGVQVRDWQRLRSEEKETLTDPDSKIIWRNDRLTGLKGTTRLFKSRFENPYPQKVVDTIDFISTRHLASYEIVAATVANPRRPPARDARRAVIGTGTAFRWRLHGLCGGCGIGPSAGGCVGGSRHECG